MLHISVYLCCLINAFKRSIFFPLIFIVSSLSTKNIRSIDWGKRGSNTLRKMKVRKYKTRMGSKYPWVWWNIFNGWTESLSLLRLRTKQRKISREENFSWGQVKLESSNVLISSSFCARGRTRVVEGVSIHIVDNGLIFMFFGTISEYLEEKDFSKIDRQ